MAKLSFDSSKDYIEFIDDTSTPDLPAGSSQVITVPYTGENALFMMKKYSEIVELESMEKEEEQEAA